MSNRKIIFMFTGLLIVSICIVFPIVSALAKKNSSFQITYLNVGQGNSALIQDGNGYDVLVDGGKPSAGPTIVAFLHEQGIDSLESIVATHADSDHIGGLIDVLNDTSISVGNVFYNGYPGDTDTWTNFVNAVANRGITITPAQFPQTYNWGDITAHILNPEPGLTYPEQNDASVVILVDYSDIEVLLTGDISASIEATVVARGTPVASEILQVAHHGSEYSSNSSFLSAVSPKEAIISVGPNSYGHPSVGVLSRLASLFANIWRTDQIGNIVVQSDGTNYGVNEQVVTNGYRTYLALVLQDHLSIVPTPIPPTATAPVLPTTTLTPTPTQTQEPGTTESVVITNIFYDGVIGSQEPDEYVEIRNDNTQAIQLQGWTLQDDASSPHVFTFPSFLMEPGQVCRVYTNEVHPEWCGFSYGSSSAIWNNSGDTAYLRDNNSNLIDMYKYP